MKHKPRKRFGQNFLTDNHVIEQILQAINPHAEDKLVEIGPGLGAITLPLLHRVNHLDVIEIDRDLIPKLKFLCEGEGQVTIHESDVLDFDLNTICNTDSSLRVIGNLPYNISTQLIFHLLKQKHLIKDMHFMLQKEVVDRMNAAPGSKTYGRLSVMVQYYCQTRALFSIPPQAFKPEPKVTSAIVKLVPHKKIPHPVHDEQRFAVIVREAFNHRRKTLQKALKDIVTADAFAKANIDPKQRPEQLSLQDFVALANQD